jgi:hypothetical protein
MKTVFTNRNLSSLALIACVIFLGVILRMIPDVPNFAPIGAIALFCGAFLGNRKFAFTLPLFILFVSDAFLGFHDQMIAIYISYALIIGLGFYIRDNVKLASAATASVAGSVLFFLISNLGVWLAGYYPVSVEGLVQCYSMAIPFFRNTFISDLLFNAILFGSYYLVSRNYPVLVKG